MLINNALPFFSVNAVARKPGKDVSLHNPYVIKFLKKTNWKPKISAVWHEKRFEKEILKAIMVD